MDLQLDFPLNLLIYTYTHSSSKPFQPTFLKIQLPTFSPSSFLSFFLILIKTTTPTL